MAICVEWLWTRYKSSRQQYPNAVNAVFRSEGHHRPLAMAKLKDVRFGSKADMCGAKRHVRFTPNSDIRCVFSDVR